MKVFISWSGNRAKCIALALREWLPKVIYKVRPWMSEVDIAAGVRWNNEIAGELRDTSFGIICVTPENQHAPWLNFEAGAIAKNVEDARNCVYLYGMEKSELAGGPLTSFQANTAEREGTKRVVESINLSIADADQMPDAVLAEAFDVWWPKLEEKLKNVPSPTEHPPSRKLDGMVAETLEIVRELRLSSNREETHQTMFASRHGRLSPESERVLEALSAVAKSRQPNDDKDERRPVYEAG